MATFRNRFPSRQDIHLVLASCVFLVHTWSVLSVLRQVPAWMLRMSSWELVGAIAYTQAFALLESLLVLLCLLAFGAILPARLLRERFATVGSMLVFLTAAWAMLAQYNSNELGLWGPKDYLPWLALYLVSIAGPYLLIRSHKRMEGAIASLVERLTVLSAFYVIVGLLSILFVVSRNIA